jgi:hypothetical protein
MKLLRRHKTVLITLGFYWPALFLLTHIPVPDIARQSGMSDKAMHVLAYFGLTFLAWYAVSPYDKVNWRRRKVWFLLAALVVYAVADEFLQGLSFIGRSIEKLDFVSNLCGVLMALAILSLAGFWASLLVFAAVFIFAIDNLSVLLTLYPRLYLNSVFHLTAYTAYTLLWIQWLERSRGIALRRPLSMLHALALPLLLLLVVKGASPFFHKTIDRIDVAMALFGISSAILLSFLLLRLTRRRLP